MKSVGKNMRINYAGIIVLLGFMFLIGGFWGMIGFILMFVGFYLASLIVYPWAKWLLEREDD